MRLSGSLAVSAQHSVDRLDPVGGFAGACVLADGGQDRGDRLAARLVVEQLRRPMAVAGARFAPARRLGRSCRPSDPPKGEMMMDEPQRLSDTEQLQILALIEAVNTERSAMRAARALAELMRRLHVLGERVAGELSNQDREVRSVRR
jgi:hypothetical protein